MAGSTKKIIFDPERVDIDTPYEVGTKLTKSWVNKHKIQLFCEAAKDWPIQSVGWKKKLIKNIVKNYESVKFVCDYKMRIFITVSSRICSRLVSMKHEWL